jgi:hypothetical protein
MMAAHRAMRSKILKQGYVVGALEQVGRVYEMREPQATQRQHDPEAVAQLIQPNVSTPVLVATTVEPFQSLPGDVPGANNMAPTYAPPTMTIKELRLIAAQKGIADDAIEHARDADDPKAELLALMRAHDDAPTPAPIDFGNKTVRELREIASTAGVTHEAIEAARDGSDPRGELIALIVAHSALKQGP